MNRLIPMGKRVLVEIPTEIKKKGGFHIDQTQGSSVKEGTLLAAGDISEFKNIKVGSTLIFTPNAGKEFHDNGRKVRILADVEVLARKQ